MAQSPTKFKSTWELLFISHRGQAAGGHGDWLERESGRHVNELNSTYSSSPPVQNLQELNCTQSLEACKSDASRHAEVAATE